MNDDVLVYNRPLPIFGRPVLENSPHTQRIISIDLNLEHEEGISK
jgi:hypothetical protein